MWASSKPFLDSNLALSGTLRPRKARSYILAVFTNHRRLNGIERKCLRNYIYLDNHHIFAELNSPCKLFTRDQEGYKQNIFYPTGLHLHDHLRFKFERLPTAAPVDLQTCNNAVTLHSECLTIPSPAKSDQKEVLKRSKSSVALCISGKQTVQQRYLEKRQGLQL